MNRIVTYICKISYSSYSGLLKRQYQKFYKKPTEFGIGIGIEEGTMSFDRITAMLTKMRGRNTSVKESEIVCY